jgi:isopentenyl-diphosphate Delta-isomerase
MDYVVLVDSEDRQMGVMEKMEAHRQGVLHRAFSVHVTRADGKILLQQRAVSKYHSGGLWTNACCSHPAPEETTAEAAVRRLKQEMGIHAQQSDLVYLGSLLYKAELDKGLTEHEFDHVFGLTYDGDPVPNPDEAEAYRWIDRSTLMAEILANPDQFTAWFRMLVDRSII